MLPVEASDHDHKIARMVQRIICTVRGIRQSSRCFVGCCPKTLKLSLKKRSKSSFLGGCWMDLFPMHLAKDSVLEMYTCGCLCWLQAIFLQIPYLPRFVYRHSWCPGDVVLCDNRSCVHRGRPWNTPSAKRMVCLVKIAEGDLVISLATRLAKHQVAFETSRGKPTHSNNCWHDCEFDLLSANGLCPL